MNWRQLLKIVALTGLALIMTVVLFMSIQGGIRPAGPIVIEYILGILQSDLSVVGIQGQCYYIDDIGGFVRWLVLCMAAFGGSIFADNYKMEIVNRKLTKWQYEANNPML